MRAGSVVEPLLASLLAVSAIAFTVESALLRSDSTGLVQNLAGIVFGCPRRAMQRVARSQLDWRPRSRVVLRAG